MHLWTEPRATCQLQTVEGWREAQTDDRGYCAWVGFPAIPLSHLTIVCPGFGPWSRSTPLVQDPPGMVNLMARLTPLEKPITLPTDRDRVCAVKATWQGLVVVTKAFGALPWTDGLLTVLSAEDRQEAYRVKRLAGDTHFSLPLAWKYDAPDLAYHIAGQDFTQDLPAFRTLCREVLTEGFYLDLRLPGDGESPDYQGGGDKDPNNPYGRGWLMANFPRIYEALADLAPWIVWCPGYDGVWYGWDGPEKVREWWRLARRVIGPKGHLGQMFRMGVCHLGDGGETFTSEAGQCLDVIYQEFPWPWGSDMQAIWQVSQRLLGPAYRAPDDQLDYVPSPFYLERGTPRGPFFAVAQEYDTYGWVRAKLSASAVMDHRRYLTRLGYTLVG